VNRLLNKCLKRGPRTDNRGIALLIVLLVTALLISLIFEFSYATRISVNSAVNFRDSQRAYFLARAGVYAFIRYTDMLTKNIPQDEWGVVPLISEGDTQVRIKWEDEMGKIDISMIRKPGLLITNPTYDWMTQLFFQKAIDQDILDKIDENHMTFQLPTQLHQVMSDQDFAKIARFVTTPMTPGNFASYKININTAPPEVLEALGINQAALIVAERGRQQISATNVKNFIDEQTYNKLSANLIYSSTKYKVYSYATVGGYTRQVEAVIQSGNPVPLYWRAL
jgi:type II secretory pathway component PulK